MRTLKTLTSALVVALVVLTCIDYAASAATGHAFVLGKINKANRMTVLKRTSGGAALKLHTTSSATAPLVVNGRGKVVNLNADSVDGFDASTLRTGTFVFTKAVSGTVSNLDLVLDLPPGSYVFGYSAFIGPAGTGFSGCYLYQQVAPGSYRIFGEQNAATQASNTYGFSGTATATVTSTTPVHFDCHTPSTFSTDPSEPIQITATRTTVLGGGNLRLAAGRTAPTP